MGKFFEADKQIMRVWVCRRCKARNRVGAEKCRKCGSPYLRPKKKEIRVKK